MTANTSSISLDSDVFYVEQLSDKPSPPRKSTLEVLNSTELSGVHPREAITISTVASPGPGVITISSVLNDPTIRYEYKRQNILFPPESDRPESAPPQYVQFISNNGGKTGRPDYT